METRCGRYRIVSDAAATPLYSVHYLVSPLWERQVLHVERSLDAALAKVQAHHAARCVDELVGSSTRNEGASKGHRNA